MRKAYVAKRIASVIGYYPIIEMELCEASKETQTLNERVRGNSAQDGKHKTKIENGSDRSLNLIMKSMLNEEKCEVTFNSSDMEVDHEKAKKRKSSNRKLTVMQKQARKVRYKCGLCEKEFLKKDHLIPHLRFHMDERPFECDECSLSFRTKGNLTVHQRVHSQERPYSCHDCGKSFKQSSSLKCHELMHKNTRKFCCDLCKKRFRYKTNLVSHSRIHTGERPFSCHLCDLSFSKKVNLTKHIQIHTGEKRFSCENCEFPFREKHHLIRHLKICKLAHSKVKRKNKKKRKEKK